MIYIKYIHYSVGLFIIIKIFERKYFKNQNEQYNDEVIGISFEPVDPKLIGISFGPTGALFSYQLGIAKYIQETFILKDLCFAGISGGVQSGYVLSLNISIDNVFDEWISKWIYEINSNNYYIPYLYIFDTAKTHLRIFNNKNNINLSKLNHKLFIGITSLEPFPCSLIKNKWDNFNNLYDSLKASQYIPFLFGLPYFKIGNNYCIDGYISNRQFEPIPGKWIHINMYDFKDIYKFQSLYIGLYNFINIFNIEFHRRQMKKGYDDAKNKHLFFTNNGLIEK